MQSACAETPIIPLPRQAIGLTPPALHAPCLLIVVPITFYPQMQGEIARCAGWALVPRNAKQIKVPAGLPQGSESRQ